MRYIASYAHKHTCYLVIKALVPVFVAKEMLKTTTDKTDIEW